MHGSRKHHIERDNSVPERQTSYIFIYKWFLDIMQRITIVQYIIPENLHNKEDPKSDMKLIYMASSKRQDLLCKLGLWGPWESVEREGRGREGNGEKYIAQ